MNQQLLIMTQDRRGLIADVSSLLSEAGINILGLEAVPVGEHACLRLSTDDPDRARNLLQDAELEVATDEMLVLRVRNAPGGLAAISRSLAEADLDIRAITMIERGQDENLVAVVTDNQERARAALSDWTIVS